MFFKFSLSLGLFVMSSAAWSHAGKPFDQKILASVVAAFDRELDQARTGHWDLNRSPAYANLMAIYSGIENPMSSAAAIEPDLVAPGTGAGGQITGSEFPLHTWALTYDDGPHPQRTEAILTVLKDFKVPATFFWLAENIVKNSAVVLKTESLGHSVQNHSYTHANLVKATDMALGFEVSVSTALMKDHYQVDPAFFRCPYGSGASNARVRRQIARENLVSVMWNVDSLDWADKKEASVVERVRKQMVKSGRGIVLFHDIQPHAASVTKKLFEVLKKSSLPIRFVAVPTAVNELNTRTLQN